MMSFGEALIYLRSGKYLYRREWNGKNIFVYYYTPSASEMTANKLAQDTYINPHFRIWNIDKKTVDSWVPSVSDILAYDWQIKEKS